DRIAFDARHLDEPADRIAGEPEVVFEADLGGVLDMFGAAAQDCAEPCRGHRAGGADLPLTVDLGPGDRRVALEQDPDRAGREQEVHDGIIARPPGVDRLALVWGTPVTAILIGGVRATVTLAEAVLPADETVHIVQLRWDDA